MPELIAENFCLIEYGKHWRSADLSSETKDVNDLIVVDYPAFGTSQALIRTMLQALLSAAEHDMPLIFNRNEQEIPVALPESGFQIGLQTSGTTGKPKLEFHSFEQLKPKQIHSGKHSRWLLCYHPMSFAGLQVILQAMLSGDTLIAQANANIQQKANLAMTERVDCLSLTPSMFRAMLLCWGGQKPALKRITFGGEICDQGTLDLCKQHFPGAEIRHIYALTEAGVIFSVKDGQAGFPAHWLGQAFHGWTLLMQEQQLVLQKGERKIITGDSLSLKDSRCYFDGRQDHIVNVGGHKVDVEKLEQQLLKLPAVIDLRVFAKKSPITGALIGLEICSLNEEVTRQALAAFIQTLPAYECPRLVQFVTQLTLSDTGKKQRIMS